MTAEKESTWIAVERAVDAEGEAWAIDRANAVRGEGRPVAGGWPGTMSEARQRVASSSTGRLRLVSKATREELEGLTRRIYDTARKAWLARVQPVSDD